MRLSVRSKVDLPQPDGPIRAVICFSANPVVTPNRAWVLP